MVFVPRDNEDRNQCEINKSESHHRTLSARKNLAFWNPTREELIWVSNEGETPVQIWRKPERIELRFGSRIVQSAYARAHPDELLLPYTRFMMLALLFDPNPGDVLHIGLGGGIIPSFLHRHFPHLRQTVVEKNHVVIEAALRFFEFPEDERTQIITSDAINALPKLERHFDLVFVDAFGPDGVPEPLGTKDFLHSVRERLFPGGWAVGNLWTLSGDFQEQEGNWKEVFTQVFEIPTRPGGNMILFGNRGSHGLEFEKLKETGEKLRKKTGLEFPKLLRKLKRV